MYTPPGTPLSRSFTRLTMRVGLLHFGQSVDFVVSITFLRSPVLAILAIFALLLLLRCLCSHPPWRTASTARPLSSPSKMDRSQHPHCAKRTRLAPSSLYEPGSGYRRPAFGTRFLVPLVPRSLVFFPRQGNFTPKRPSCPHPSIAAPSISANTLISS